MYKRRRVKRRRGVGRKRKRTASRRGRTLTKKIKQVMYKAIETKTLGECDFVVLNENSFYWRFLNDVPKYDGGNTNLQFQTRFGQAYQLLGFSLDFLFTLDPAILAGAIQSVRPMMVRCVVLEAKSEQAVDLPATTTDMFIKEDSSRLPFVGTPGIGRTFDSMALPIDHKKYKTIRDIKFVLGTGTSASNGFALKRIKQWIPIKKTVNCNQMNSGELQQDRGYFVGVWMYDPFLVVNPTATRNWNVSQSWKTYWKDP